MLLHLRTMNYSNINYLKIEQFEWYNEATS